MDYLLIVTAVIIIFLLYARFEAGWVEVRYVKHSGNMRGLKLVHLSDIHIARMKAPVKTIRRIITKEKPDLIVMTGDYIEKPGDTTRFLRFLDQTVQGYPVYLCLGNHDYLAFKGDTKALKAFVRKMQDKGLHVLRNQSVVIEKNNKKYILTGLEDLREGKPDIKEAAKSKHADVFVGITFSHNPDLVLQFPRNHTDYFLCGHFHGGQIWFPMHLEFKVLRKDVLCKKGITRGLHKINGIRVYINRGLGNVCVPFRFFSRPEITVHHLP